MIPVPHTLATSVAPFVPCHDARPSFAARYGLGPLGGSEGVESYQAMLRYNASVIAAALGNNADR